MCMPIIIQYRELENLLHEIEPGKPVHLHVLEQIKTTTYKCPFINRNGCKRQCSCRAR